MRGWRASARFVGERSSPPTSRARSAKDSRRATRGGCAPSRRLSRDVAKPDRRPAVSGRPRTRHPGRPKSPLRICGGGVFSFGKSFSQIAAFLVARWRNCRLAEAFPNEINSKGENDGQVETYRGRGGVGRGAAGRRLVLGARRRYADVGAQRRQQGHGRYAGGDVERQESRPQDQPHLYPAYRNGARKSPRRSPAAMFPT